jgi:hypothetical protein
MNRRSILTSLSSMCLAALAWPRETKAGPGGAAALRSGKDSKGAPPVNLYVRVKNALVIEGGVIVPGQYPLNVWAYDPAQVKTLQGGEIGAYKSENVTGQFNVLVTIQARNTGTPPRETSLSFLQPALTTLYYFAYSNGPAEAPTITQAPTGVTF